MKKLRKTFFPLLTGAALSLTGVLSVHAQESLTEEFTLEEITVTAEKREVNVQKTAMEITAVSGADIDNKSITDVAKVLDGLAGVKVMGGAQGSKIFIRGIGSSLDTNSASPSVALQKDNVYLGQSEAVASTLYDIDRVEVLYGPQGTMYGKNAAGGQVNVITKNPTDRFESSANLSIGDYNLANWNAALNVPFSSKWAARVAVDRQKHDAYVSDGSGTANKLATRVKVSYKPTDRLSVLLTSEFSWDKSWAMSTVPAPGSAGNMSTDNFVVPDVNGDGVADDFLDADLNTTDDLDEDGYPDGDGIKDIQQTGWVLAYGADAWTTDEWHVPSKSDYRYQIHSLQIDWDMGWSKLTLIPTLNKNYREMYSNFITGIAEGTGNISNAAAWRETQWSGEARLSSTADSPVIWTLGAFWYKSNNKEANQIYTDLMDSALDTWENGSGSGVAAAAFRGVGGSLSALQGPPPTASVDPYASDNALTANYRTPQDSMAAFGQLTYPVTDRFRLTGGLRWNNDNNNMKYRIIIMDVTTTGKYSELYDKTTAVEDANATGGVRHTYDTGIKTYTVDASPLTYTGGFEFDLGQDKMLYGSVKTGYKNGGLNLQSTVPPLPYDPEELIAYSLGSKNRFMNNQLQVNIEAYYYDYKGYQVQVMTEVWDPLTESMGRANMVVNADKGTNSGLDINADWMITFNDKLSASLAYMKTEFGELILPGGNIGGSSEYDLTGTDLPKAPHWSGTLGYEHTFMLNNGGSVTPSLQTKISSGYWSTHEKYLAGAWQGHYRTSDFYLTYMFPNGNYSATIWGKNLENTAVTDYVFPMYRMQISEPRTTGITFSARF
ncbi:MAG: TonB-dependent receptor [Deltaproteobacteria bacterium]|nr:TonB-dependent receptor [Deltaproteobacteria bacterium]